MKQNRAQYLFRFGYVGHYYHGLEPQKHLPTAGGHLAKEIEKTFGERPRALQFSARTDAGVHALENTATCWFKTAVTPSLGGVQTARFTKVPYNVHARGSAEGKHYRYVIEDGCDPLSPPNPFAWQIAPHIDIDRLKLAASFLVGEHDFSSFRASGCSASTPIKKIEQIKIDGPISLRLGRRQFHINVTGNAFLRKMIRNIAGTLLEAACGLREPEELKEILAAKKRSASGITAPACGLTLMQVRLKIPASHKQTLQDPW